MKLPQALQGILPIVKCGGTATEPQRQPQLGAEQFGAKVICLGQS